MKVSFLLPNSGEIPIGGVLMVFEYANRLVKLGHKVSVFLTPDMTGAPLWRFIHFVTRLLRIRGNYKPVKWFQLDKKVALHWLPFYHSFFIPDADVIIATYWLTAKFIDQLPSSKGKRFYLVPDFELYMSSPSELQRAMESTFRGPHINLPISPACEEMIRRSGAHSFSIQPVGINLDVFKPIIELSSPQRQSIGFPFRGEVFKGTPDAIAAIEKIHLEFPDISVWTFGKRKPASFPSWITFYESPTFEFLVSLYNKTKIFVTASHYEGWGLPGLEAMMCGAALVSTEHGGVSAYARHSVNSLLSPIRDIERLTQNIKCLILDDSLRISLVQTALSEREHFDWNASVQKLISTISEV